MIKAIRLENFRSIADSGWVALAPLTLLVGKNSSGKSSFLRLLPLLKQSLTEETKEPLLWFGRLVDFGGLDEVKSTYCDPSEEVRFRFLVELSRAKRHEVAFTETGDQIFMVYPSPRVVFDAAKVDASVGLSLRKKEEGEGNFVSKLTLEIFGESVEFRADEKGIVTGVLVSGAPFDVSSKVRFAHVKGRFFPHIISADEQPRPDRFISREEGPFFAESLSSFDIFFHGNTSQKKRRELLGSIKLAPLRQFYDSLTKISTQTQRVAPWPESLKQPPTAVLHAWRKLLIRYSIQIFRDANVELTKLASSVRYLAPVRADASRYYRFQELAVDEIDPRGDNVPMFINSLSEPERHSLESWMQTHLGFKVTATRSGGHTALFVTEEGATVPLNLADTGFGYSQILPVALQIWRSLEKVQQKPNERQAQVDRSSLITIEQPELHLHPQFQAVLADLFAATIVSNEVFGSLGYIIETHSEHLINRLGALVESGQISPQAISIVLFDKPAPTAPASVRQSHFDSNGVLSGDWPFGFFVPEF